MDAIWSGSEDFPLYGYIIRAVMAYIILLILMKVLGQRSLSSLQPTDFLYAIVIGDIIGEPLSSGESEFTGPLSAALTLSAIHFTLSYLTLKGSKFRRITDDEPLFLVRDGRILREELKKTKVTLDMLLMEMRLRDVPNIADVDTAILEANGEISIIPKEEKQPVTKEDMDLPAPRIGYPTVIIEDGNLLIDNLKKHDLDREWLQKQLEDRGISDPQDIMLATVTKSGEFYCSRK